MKNLFVIISIIAGFALVSCSNKTSKSTDVKPEIPITGQNEGHVIDGTFVHENDSLSYKFDNANSTAILKYKGEDIRLKQDTMASGIKYSNDNYVYTEHQGKVTLSKDGKTIFSHQK